MVVDATGVSPVLKEETLENALAELVALGADPGFVSRSELKKVLPNEAHITTELETCFREQLAEEEIELREEDPEDTLTVGGIEKLNIVGEPYPVPSSSKLTEVRVPLTIGLITA